MVFPNSTEAGHGVAASLFFAAAFLAASLSDVGPLQAEAYVPTDDSVVLERLRPASDATALELKGLVLEAKAQPDRFSPTGRLIRRYIQLARAEGDPRYAGYAEAALDLWARDRRPPPEALFLRATLLQYRHDFEGAIQDLDQVIDRRPDHAEARLARATIHLVRADYDLARRDCDALSGLTAALISEVCNATIRSLTGEADLAYQSLKASFDQGGGRLPPSLQGWVLQTLGEIAARLGEVALAERHYRAAIEAGGGDLYLTCALFDLLLDDGRPSEAEALLGDDTRPDLLLLRHAQAAKALGDRSFDNLARDLELRFAESRLRGDERHLREEARFRLLLDGEADPALDLALRNWESQRETADARLVLEAARAAKRAEAAAPVIAWLEETGLDDAAIAPVAAEIKEISR